MKHIYTHLKINVKIDFVPYLHHLLCQVEYKLSEIINFCVHWGGEGYCCVFIIIIFTKCLWLQMGKEMEY